MIPILWRYTTVRVRPSFRLPFTCEACHLVTAATVWVEASGSTTSVFIRPSEQVAASRAHAAAWTAAQRWFALTPCPRCGGPCSALAVFYADWDKQNRARKQLRFRLSVAILALTLAVAGGCAAHMRAQLGGAHGLEEGLRAAPIWLILGSIATVVVFLSMSTVRAPSRLAYVPPNVVFDPPPGS